MFNTSATVHLALPSAVAGPATFHVYSCGRMSSSPVYLDVVSALAEARGRHFRDVLLPVLRVRRPPGHLIVLKHEKYFQILIASMLENSPECIFSHLFCFIPAVYFFSMLLCCTLANVCTICTWNLLESLQIVYNIRYWFFFV